MTDYAQSMFRLLAQGAPLRSRIGLFAGSGVVDVPLSKAPQVDVGGLGRLGSPMPPQQAAALIEEMQQAPYGLGHDTLVDVSVRRAWQLGADRVLLNARWTCDALPDIVKEACEQLGLDAVSLGVQAHLYKLLCYEAGGHFKSHRDTEKEPGMFATLIVQLPSEHKGGDLVVQHHGEQVRFNFATGSADTIRYATFYADCEHILEPVTEGVRLVLAYNLVRTKADRGLYPLVGEQQAARAQITEVVQGWTKQMIQEKQDAVVAKRAEEEEEKKKEENAENEVTKTPKIETPPSPLTPKKFVYLLGHRYSKTSLSFDSLKGTDRTLLRALRSLIDPHQHEAGARAGSNVNVINNEPLLDVYLCLIQRKFTHNYYDMENVTYDYEETLSLPLWIGERGTKLPFPLLDIDLTNEVLGRRTPYGERKRYKSVELDPSREDIPSGKEEEKQQEEREGEEAEEEEENDPLPCYEWADGYDDQHNGGLTGNEGCTDDTWYYTAAIVFWPRSEAFRMVSEAGSFLRLAELAEDAVARGAPYADKYLSDVLDILANKDTHVREKHRWRGYGLGDAIRQDFDAIFRIVFKTVSSMDTLSRAVKASVVRNIDFEKDGGEFIKLLTDAIMRIGVASLSSSCHTDAATYEDGDDGNKKEQEDDTTGTKAARIGLTEEIITAFEPIFYTPRLARCFAEISFRINIEAAEHRAVATARHIVAATSENKAALTVASLLSEFAERKAVFTAEHARSDLSSEKLLVINTATPEVRYGVKTTPTPKYVTLLPFLGSFDGSIPILEKAVEETRDVQLSFSSYVCIAGAVLAAPRMPSVRPKGHDAIATVLRRCAAAFLRSDRDSFSKSKVAWMFWALLQLSKLQQPALPSANDGENGGDITTATAAAAVTATTADAADKNLLCTNDESGNIPVVPVIAIAAASAATGTEVPTNDTTTNFPAADATTTTTVSEKEKESPTSKADDCGAGILTADPVTAPAPAAPAAPAATTLVPTTPFPIVHAAAPAATTLVPTTPFPIVPAADPVTDAPATTTPVPAADPVTAALVPITPVPTVPATATEKGYRCALESLADAIKTHSRSRAILKPLLANADVQDAIRHGDSICRSLCEYRVQQLLVSIEEAEAEAAEAAIGAVADNDTTTDADTQGTNFNSASVAFGTTAGSSAELNSLQLLLLQ